MEAKPRALTIMVLLALFLVGPVGSLAAAEKVNINTATVDQLTTLDGIGDAYAKKIVEYRDAHGAFKSPEDIMNVSGIGPATFAKNKDRITVGAPAAPKTDEASKPSKPSKQ